MTKKKYKNKNKTINEANEERISLKNKMNRAVI
jgi:hypothetical protein